VSGKPKVGEKPLPKESKLTDAQDTSNVADDVERKKLVSESG
jgi:hypothetical protein